jgi:hypothetical protein
MSLGLLAARNLNFAEEWEAKMKSLMKVAARLPLIKWITLCIGVTMLLLVVYDWRAEADAWVQLSSAGVPIWAIVVGIAVGWLQNGTFWAWIFLASMAGWALRDHARKLN